MLEKIKKIERKIRETVSGSIECREYHSSIVLDGRAECWSDVVKAGKTAAHNGYRGVVNNIECCGVSEPPMKIPLIKDMSIDKKHVDVMIIGGGVIGCAIAREMSKWDVSILLVDKEEDLALHASSRNDGMIHPGFAVKPGTKKADCNIRGNEMYDRIAKELDVDFKRTGLLVTVNKKAQRLLYPLLAERCHKNGVKGLEYIPQDKLFQMEPHIDKSCTGAFSFPTTGVISPYKLTVAYGENAVMNGAKFSLNTVVTSMNVEKGKIISVNTNRGTVFPKVVINSAGVYADKIAEMAGDKFFTIHPRKGQIVILDKKKGIYVNHSLARLNLSLTSSDTKGGGIVKTIDDNILVGPDAVEQPYREDFSTDYKNIDSMLKTHLPIIPCFSKGDTITYFSGIRACTYDEDFVIEKSLYIENLIFAAGIQSPGLVSAPAVAEDIEKLTVDALKNYMEVKRKANWQCLRAGIPDLRSMDRDERSSLIKRRPDYGTIVCRCEEISKGEIIDAVHSPVPVTTIDGIKRRVRAGMGRCQGGFCTPAVLKILEEETGMGPLDITKKGRSSNLVVEETKTGS